MATGDLPLGSLVDSTLAGRGVVRFCGNTQFAPGKWVGVELFEPNGKNDGTVQGVRYFSCKPGHGVFVARSKAKLITEETPSTPATPSAPAALPAPPTPRTAGPATGVPPSVRQRAAASHQRTSSAPINQVSLGQSASRPSPLRAGSSADSDSPKKPAPGGSATRPTPGSRPSARNSRLSISVAKSTIAPPQFGESDDAKPTPTQARFAHRARASVAGPLAGRTQTKAPATAAAAAASAAVAPSPQAPPALLAPSPPPLESSSGFTVSPSISPEPSVSGLVPPILSGASEELELRAKLRVIEVKRADDAQRIRELEARLGEAENFVSLRPKLQAKLNELQKELVQTKRDLQDKVAELSQSEGKLSESTDHIEMLTLDREMAEERAEIAESELEGVKEHLAVAEVELKVLREGGGGGAGLGEVSAEQASAVKSNLAYIQLEKQNERLKEALVRLRDMTSEVEQEQRHKLQDLERELAASEEMQSEFDATLQKLANAEDVIESLKEQLDAALTSEDMLEKVTERNYTLMEKIEEMRVVVEDLETLKEINDELEENHVETEQALQDELNEKDLEIRDQQRRIERLEESLMDYEQTIGQFRELVSQLTGELETLRMQTQNAQNQSAMAASQTATVLSLNMKLQSTASKYLAKNIDLELRKLEAKEGKELLSIVQPYLPQVYLESDSDATNAYLFFQRVGYKADLINTIVAQVHNIPESLSGAVTESLVGICDMRGRISHLSALCKRFAAVLRRCDPESFLNTGRIYAEVAPMEKRMDMHIDLLRREEFRALECVTDVGKMLGQFEHLAEAYFGGYEFDLAERELDLALSFDHDIDFIAAAIGLAKTHIQAAVDGEDQEVETGETNPEEDLMAPLQRLLDQTRHARGLAKKLTKRIETLTEDSSALKAGFIASLNEVSTSSANIVNFSVGLAQRVGEYVNDVKGKKETFVMEKIIEFVKEAVKEIKGDSAEPMWEVISDSLGALNKQAGEVINSANESESVVKISGKAPWVLRIEEIKRVTAVNLEAEREIVKLNEQVQDLFRTIKTKDQSFQEQNVKIQVMERRAEVSKKQADVVTEMEEQLKNEKKQVKMYEEAMETLRAEVEELHQDNAKLKQTVNSTERQAQGAQQSVEVDTVQVETNLETSHLLDLIESLRGAVKFLRTENGYLKGQDMLRELGSLPPLDTPSNLYVPSSTPPLVDDLSSEEEEESEDSTEEDEDEDEDEDSIGTGSDNDSYDSRPKRKRKPKPKPKPAKVEPPKAPEAPARKKPTLQALSTETTLLYRRLLDYSASPRLVDLEALQNERKQAWVPQKKTTAHQLWERKKEAEKLGKRVRGLMERVESVKLRAL